MSTEEVKTETATETTTETPAETPAEEEKKEETELPVEGHKETRAEKKMKASLLKFNLKKMEKVSTVTMRRGNQTIFTFSNPEVYYVDDVYVIFGESRYNDAASDAINTFTKASETTSTEAAAEEPKATVAGEEELSAEGLDEGDIATIMEQGNVSRNRAIQALRETNGDVVNAVMKLSID